MQSLFFYFQKSAEIVDMVEAPFKSAIPLLPQQLLQFRGVKLEKGWFFSFHKYLPTFFFRSNIINFISYLFQIANICTKCQINITVAPATGCTYSVALNLLSITFQLDYLIKLQQNRVSIFYEPKYIHTRFFSHIR